LLPASEYFMFNPTVAKRINTKDRSVKSLTLILINSNLQIKAMYVYTITTSWYYKDVCKKVDNEPINTHFCQSLETELELGKMTNIMYDSSIQN
jgi:hypothetical protein